MILGGIGLSHLLADSSIASSFKYWLIFKENENGAPQKRWGNYSCLEWFFDKVVEMMNCHQCNGFWSGLAVFAIARFAGFGPEFGRFELWALVWGFMISLLSPVFAAIYVYIVSLTTFEDSDEE
jgi:hypothetical protein